MPPAVFGQMLRNAAEPMRRLLLATGTTTPPGIPRDHTRRRVATSGKDGNEWQ